MLIDRQPCTHCLFLSIPAACMSTLYHMYILPNILCPNIHGEDARPRVGRMPHSQSSILVGTRAADHLHVGSSRETFADIIGKKVESLPLKLLN